MQKSACACSVSSPQCCAKASCTSDFVHCCKKPTARSLFYCFIVLPKLGALLILFHCCNKAASALWILFHRYAIAACALSFIGSMKYQSCARFGFCSIVTPKPRCFLLLSVKLRLSVLCYIVTQVFLAFFVWCGLHELVTSVYDYVVSSPQVVFFPSFEYEHVIRKNSVNRYTLISHEFHINLGETFTYQLEQLWQQLRVR